MGTVAGTGGDVDNVYMVYAWVQPKEYDLKTVVLQNKDKEDGVPPVGMDVLGSAVDRKHRHLDNDQTK